MPSSMLGVDIGSSAVKIVELFDAKGQGNYKIGSYGIEALPAGAVKEKSIVEQEVVGDALKRAYRRSRASTNRCALAVSVSSAITKKITISGGLSERQIEEQISLEAEQYIPYPLEEINFDFQVLGETAAEDAVEVLLAATKSENVEALIAVSERAGLKPQVVEIESHAIEAVCRTLSHPLMDASEQGNFAVLDIGEEVSVFLVVSHGQLLYTREQSFGCHTLTEQICSSYGLSREDAERMKKEGKLPSNYEQELLAPFCDTVAQQANRFLQFFYSTHEQQEIDELLLAGGATLIPGCDRAVAAVTGVETRALNPFDDIAVSRKVVRQRLQEDAPLLNTAFGLALAAMT